MEGLFIKGLKGKLSRELIEQLKLRGLDLDKPLLPAYPRTVVTDVVLHTARSLYPDLSESDAMYQVGKHVTPGQANTILGAATLKVLRLVGPHRTIERLARTFRTTNNYMTVTLTRASTSSYELELTPSNEYPSYMQAVIEDMLALTGAKDVEVKVLLHDTARELCRYGISWR